MKRQQAKFIKDRFLSKVGGQFIKVDKATFPILEQTLIQSGLDFNDTIRKNLEKARAISTGKLTEVGVPNVTINEDNITLNVGYPLGSNQLEYYDFINKGVKGVGGKNAKPKRNSGDYSFKSRFPNRKMAASILSWLRTAKKSISADRIDLSGVQKKRRKLSQVVDEAKNRKSLAFAISSAIKRDGIRATYYFDRAIKENFGQDFVDSLAEALGGDIILNIRQYGNNNSN